MITTWTITRPAVAAAWPALDSGGSALDAVEAARRWAEDDPANQTVARGGWPDRQHRRIYVCRGHGELVSAVCGAFLAVEAIRAARVPLEAAKAVLQRVADNFTLTEQDQVGLIVLWPSDQFAVASVRPGFSAVVRSPILNEVKPADFTLVD